jgi:hypothetical protein
MSDDLDALIVDARLVLQYGTRSGLLRHNHLADAIDALTSQHTASGPEFANFAGAFKEALKDIEPMTLVDLRAGRSPFDARNVKSRMRWQVSLSLATVGLIASIAFYQFQVQQVTDALAAFHEAQEAKLSEKVTAARQFAQYRKALDENSCSFGEYQRARHELRKLDSRAASASNTVGLLYASSPWPFADQVVSAVRLFSQSPALPVAAAGPQPAASAAADADAALTVDDAPATGGACSEVQRRKLLAQIDPEWLRKVMADGLDDYCYAESQRLGRAIQEQTQDNATLFNSSEDPVPALQQRVRIQSAWLLPFLYGLLGACVYVMRRLLFDTRHAAVENVVILLRLALGALAGVVIGWFSTPAVPSTLLGGGPGSWPYILAFLAGFSIDNLFTALDRVNGVLSGKDKAAPAGT